MTFKFKFLFKVDMHGMKARNPNNTVKATNSMFDVIMTSKDL